MIFFPALAASPINTKVAGLAWALLVLVGLAALCRHRTLPRPERASVARRASLWWLGTTLVFALGTVLMSRYWAVPFKEHEETWRLGLMALAVWGLSAHIGPDWRMRWQQGACFAAALACVVALPFIFLVGRGATPTNAIPWAAGVAMLCTVVWPSVFLSPWHWLYRLGLALASLCGVLAVLISETRGSYALVPWLMLTALCLGWQAWSRQKRNHRRGLLRLLIVVVVLAGLSGLVLRSHTVTNLVKSKVVLIDERVALAGREAQAVLEHPDSGEAANTSVGARIVLWRLALRDAREHWVLGVGRDQRMQKIKAEGERIGSGVVASLSHTHQEYLHAMWDYGIVGLLALLALQVGLLVMAILAQGVARWQLLGLWFMHAATGLTNVNFAHNYYSLMLSVSIAIVLLGPWPARSSGDASAMQNSAE